MAGICNRVNELCMKCGLCCDGTLYDSVEILADERAQLLREKIPIDAAGGKEYMRQPCEGLSGTTCSIYAIRPATCRKFKCFVLTRLENGAITLDQADALVSRALQAVADVESFALPGENRVAQRLRWLRTRAECRDNPEFYLKMIALYVFIDREFYREDRRKFEFKQA